MKLSRLAAALLLLQAVTSGEPANPKVLERYKQMLAANPVEGIALERLWNSAAEAGATEQLIAEYRKVETFAGQMVLGHLLRKAGQDESALAAYAKAAKADVASPLPALAIAKLEASRTHPKEAAAQLEKAAGLLPDTDPRKPDTLLQLGTARLAAGEPGKAAAAWERTVGLDPANLELRRRLATAYADNALPEQAITHLEYVVDHGPPAERTMALQQIARLQSASGHPGEAMKALERAVAQTAPDHWMRSDLLGQIIRIAQRQRVEGDLEAKWKQQVEQSPRDLGGYLQLVEFYERTGDLEKEREWLEKVLGLAPKNQDLRLKLARLLVQIDQVEAAIPLYDTLLAAQPGNTDLIFERARLDLQREDAEPARQRIAAMLAHKPGDESLRSKALEFYQEYHLHDLTEQHLQADAAKGGEDEVFALASFYFAQHRVPEARAALARLLHPQDPAEKRAALLLRTAQMLKAQGETDAAVESAQAATTAKPDARDGQLLLGELLDAEAQYDDARAAYTKAYALSATDADRLEADGKIFQSIRTEHSETAAPATRPRQELAQAAVEDHIRSLMTLAGTEKAARGWLRVAQWKAWNGDKGSAVTFGSKAAELEPDNPAPHEFLARLAIANGDPAFAVLHFRQLIDINPARKSDYEREIAELQLQRGNVADALEMYAAIARRNPGSGAALADLATAQERARKLDDAAGTWRKALAALPVQRKSEASAALLRVLQDLGKHEEATSILLTTVDETADEHERLARFDELLLYAQQHDRMDWLRAKFEERRKMRADDYFTAVALGRIMKMLGEKGAAFELFADAALSAPKQAEALPELIREAEEQQRLDTAVRLQEQFTRIAPQQGPDGFIKLAALCEKTGDLEGAERAWARAVAKFPRDIEVLRRASDFHQQWGDLARAATLLRKMLALDPANPRVAAALGTLEFDAGRLDEARTAFETVMRLTKPVEVMIYPGDSEAIQNGETEDRSTPRRMSTTRPFPMFSKTHSLLGYANGKPSPEAEMRLGALRRLAEIARQRGGADLQKWLADWANPADGPEPLWALYFSGARAALLDRIEELSAGDPQNPSHRRAWIWIALESGEAARLAAWLHGSVRSAAELEAFTSVFEEFVKSRPAAVDVKLVQALFPPGARTRISHTAATLLSAHRYPEALALGERVFAITGTQRAAVGRELAQMQLALGHPDEARRLLAQAAEGEGEWFDSPVYEAMRDYMRLAPPAERAEFIRKKLAAADDRTAHGWITRVVLHAMEGDDQAAAAALTALLAAHASPSAPGQKGSTADRRAAGVEYQWGYLIRGSTTLTNWGRPDLALRLWERTFADEGLVATKLALARRRPTIDNDEDGSSAATLAETAGQMRDALAYLRGGRIEKTALLESYASATGGLERLTDQLNALAARDAAVEVSRYAWERSTRDPSERGATDPFALRRLMDACAAAGDEATAETVRRRVLAEKLSTGSDSTPTQFARELSEQMEQRGDVAGALKVVTSTLASFPDEQLAVRHAELVQRSAGPAAAEAELRVLARAGGGSALSTEHLAELLERQGRLTEALAVRRRGGSGAADPRLPLLLYRNGQSEEARSALERLPASYSVYAAMTLAEAMGLAGEAKAARSVLVAAASRALDPRAQLQLRSKLLRIPGAAPSVEFTLRMQARMRASVVAQPELAEGYYQFFDHYAEALGIAPEWKAETERAWAEGRGPFPAGLSLLRRGLASGDTALARTVCERMAARIDINSTVLGKASALLAAARQTGLRLLLAEAEARVSLVRFQPAMAWVRLLQETGSGEKAREVLTGFGTLAMFDGGSEVLGRTWLDLGDAEKARGFLEQALVEDSLNPSPSLLAAMARVQIATKRLPAARLLLRRAFAVPSCREYEALAEYLGVAGDFSRWRESVREFALPPSAEYGLGLAIFARLEKQSHAAEAFAFIGENRSLVSLVSDEAQARGISGERLRALAKKSGAYQNLAAALTLLSDAKIPGAAAELLALQADQAEGRGEDAQPLLERASILEPGRWEFARRLAEGQLKSGAPAKARGTLARYLGTPGKPLDREAAFDLWERCQR